MTSPEQFHRLRSMQPSRPSSEAYAQMERMRAASMKVIGSMQNESADPTAAKTALGFGPNEELKVPKKSAQSLG